VAYTQAHLDALDAAIAQGATRVRFADREVTYRDLPDMQATRALIVSDINKAAGVMPRRARRIQFVTGKGL